MSDYEIGYGRPPRHSRFKKGTCPNPAGRGKHRAREIGAVTRDILEEPANIAVRGRQRQLSRMEIWIRRCVASAVKGDIDSAASLLKIRDNVLRIPELSPMIIRVTGGFADNRSADSLNESDDV